MKAERRVICEGLPLAFSCATRRHRTDVTRGRAHGERAATRGSVFAGPLVERDGYTLWLEFVAPSARDTGGYWLVWYDPFGTPAFATSTLLEHDDVLHMRDVMRAFE